MGEIAFVFAFLNLPFIALLGVYLTKAIRTAGLKKRLRGAVTQFAAIPQVHGEVTDVFMQDGILLSRVQYTDQFGAAHFADLICEQGIAPEIGTPVVLRAAEQPVPQIVFRGSDGHDGSVLAMQDTLNKTGLVMTEQRWNEVIAMMTKKQKELGRAYVKYGLFAAGSGMVSALTTLFTIFLIGRL